MGSTRVRRPVALGRSGIDVIADFPLEMGLMAWGLIIGPVALLDSTPSGTLALMPGWLDQIWSALLLIAATSIIVGLRRRQVSPFIANALYLFAAAFAVYGLATQRFNDFSASGASGLLYLSLAAVCVIRGRRLRQLFYAAIAEAERKNGNGGNRALP